MKPSFFILALLLAITACNRDDSATAVHPPVVTHCYQMVDSNYKYYYSHPNMPTIDINDHTAINRRDSLFLEDADSGYIVFKRDTFRIAAPHGYTTDHPGYIGAIYGDLTLSGDSLKIQYGAGNSIYILTGVKIN